MIETREQYLQAMEALRNIEEALAALRAKLGPERAALFQAMARDYLDSINEIREEIDQYTGAAEAAAARAPVWLGLEGADLSPHNIKTALLATWLERMRKSVAALVNEQATRTMQRPRQYLSPFETCDFRLVGFRPGSLKVGLDIPEPRQMSLFEGAGGAPEELVREALERLLNAATEFEGLHRSRRTREVWPAGIPLEQQFLYRQVLRITPGKRERVHTVLLEGALVPSARPVLLDAPARAALTALLSAEPPEGAIEELEGRLREIDLDKRRFILRERPDDEPDVAVFFADAQCEEAKAAVDRRVRVGAAQAARPRTHWKALVIEQLEEAPL